MGQTVTNLISGSSTNTAKPKYSSEEVLAARHQISIIAPRDPSAALTIVSNLIAANAPLLPHSARGTNGPLALLYREMSAVSQRALIVSKRDPAASAAMMRKYEMLNGIYELNFVAESK